VTRERRYTLREASALIGPLRELVQSMRAARDTLQDGDLITRAAEGAPGNGGGEAARRLADARLVLERGARQLEAWAVVVRDLDEGICDFPARRQGRDVYLCWRVGEERITHWHELGGGFAGRRALDELTE
jgi:hypothetical protein